MKKKRKVAVVTSTRAEYGLLSMLMREIEQDAKLNLQVIVSGMHLSPEFGLTYKFIEEDGFNIDAKVEMLMSSDTPIGIAKSMGLGVIGFADVFSRLTPDIVVLLGDRYESLAVAQAALIQKIPVAHIHGGELSEGAIDDAIRHSITKMSHLHFVAADVYKKRVIQLGEHPNYVFNTGSPGIERIRKMRLLEQNELETRLNFKFGKTNFLITYHPETLAIIENENSLKVLFEALDEFKDVNIIFTKANADEAGRFINSQIDAYVLKNTDRCRAFVSLGDLNYLSILQFIDLMAGNSSSGLIEVPYFKKPTINIGNRQKNRLRTTSIIDCYANKNEIIEAIKTALSPTFQNNLKNTVSLYSQDQTAFKIKEIIKQSDLNAILLKSFNDINF